MSVGESLVVPERFNGPRDSGQGGYCAGRLAGLVDGPVDVSLRRPVPLGVPLAVERGATVRLSHEGAVVAEVRAGREIAMDAPRVGVEEAREASLRYRGSGFERFDDCYVCGRAREDSFGVFAAQVEGRDVVASPWTPPAWAAGATGDVAQEHVWAVLDCPTYFALHIGRPFSLSVTARLSAQVRAPIAAGTEHVVVAWPLAADGNKRHAASAVLTAEGDVLAVARTVWVDLARS